MTVAKQQQGGTVKTRGPVTRVLDALSSVWLGVTLMFLLFVYMSVGSAGYAVRQSRWFEMTEYEWFHWWPFDVMIGLLCVNLTVVTLRRIPLRVVNLGVWMIHAGIIVLCIGSVVYFSQKIEGDTPVFRRSVTIESSGHEPVTLVALPGAQTSAGEGDAARMYEVVSTDPSWPILSGEDAGEKAYAVTVRVLRPDGSWFQRQLLDGYPQYTEDILPTGRAVKSTGKRLVDEDLRMALVPWVQDEFFLSHTWALYFREAGLGGGRRVGTASAAGHAAVQRLRSVARGRVPRRIRGRSARSRLALAPERACSAQRAERPASAGRERAGDGLPAVCRDERTLRAGAA